MSRADDVIYLRLTKSIMGGASKYGKGRIFPKPKWV